MGQVLQSETDVVTKWDRCYKVRRLLQSGLQPPSLTHILLVFSFFFICRYSEFLVLVFDIFQRYLNVLTKLILDFSAVKYTACFLPLFHMGQTKMFNLRNSPLTKVQCIYSHPLLLKFSSMLPLCI